MHFSSSLIIVLKVRVGEVGGQASGYNGGCFALGGSAILATSYFGGFYAWLPDEVAVSIIHFGVYREILFSLYIGI